MPYKSVFSVVVKTSGLVPGVLISTSLGLSWGTTPLTLKWYCKNIILCCKDFYCFYDTEQ